MRFPLPKGTAKGLMAFTVALIAGLSVPQFTVAQSQSQAQLAVRVQELEDTVRTLTGQVEGLQFQLTQMQELIQKMQDDNEFRFQQLEGGAGKKTSAATQTGGVTPSGASPQAQTGENTVPAATAEAESSVAPPPADVGQAGDASSAAGQADDGLGQSQDPLLGKGGGEGALGALPDDGSSHPLDLTLNSSEPISNGDSEAQYKAGYDAIVRGDYQFAEDQFRQFIALYPKDAQAADATNWLGEALLQRGAFDEAADVLLTGFQTYQKSPRAPDLLLKLGIALAGAGESDTACRTFFEVAKRYPKQPAAFNERLQAERQKTNCPA